MLKIGPFGNQFYNISVRNIRNVIEKDVDILKKGELGCLAIKQLNKDFNFKREHIKKGMYITNNPFCCHEFIAKIYILHHPTTIRENYQSTIHCGSVIQAAKITEIINIKKNVASDNKLLRTGDQAKVRFQFLFKPEFIENESMFIFRENNAKGVGKIINTLN
jgi:elongation factor 1-alpha